MKDQYVLEWSKQQNAFHIQPLAYLLAQNQECFINNKTHQYITLMIGSGDACSSMARSWRHWLHERDCAENIAIEKLADGNE